MSGTGYESIAFKVNVSRQIIAALAASIGTFSTGLMVGWSSPALPDIELSQQFGIISQANQSWISSIVNIGAAISSCLCGYLVGQIGRKWTIIMLNIPVLLGWLLMIFSSDINTLIIGRFFTGFAGGFFFTCPMFISEISQASIRGRLCLISNIAMVSGILFASVMGIFTNWIGLSVICIIFPLIQLVAMTFVPESPFSLLVFGRVLEARVALKWFRGTYFDEDIEAELKELHGSARECLELRSTLHYSDLMNWKLWKPCSIPIILMFLQQFCGFNAISFNAVYIFQATGSTLDAYICSALLGLSQVVAVIAAATIIDKLGRRFILLTSCGGTAVSIFAVGIYFYFLYANNGLPPPGLGWLPLLSLTVYMIAFNFGIGPIPWVLSAELAPSQIKGLSAAASATVSWLATFLVTKEFQDISAGIHMYGAFFLFSGFGLISALYVYLFVPETKGISLSEIQRIFF